MPLNPKCIFCQIAAGEAEASFVLRQDDVIAFLDVAPLVPGHALVVPRPHHAGLADLPDALGGRMMAAARRVALGMRRALGQCEGVNFFLADGAAAGQTVFHCHLHVIPRRRGDGFGVRRPSLAVPSRRDLEEQAARLRAACEGEGALPAAVGDEG